VVRLEGRGHARIMSTVFSSLGSCTCTTWKRRVSAGSFSKYFLYSPRSWRRSCAGCARERGLQKVRRVSRARGAAGANERVRFVNETG